MKICKYCRTKYDDNLVCCPNCAGTKVITEQELAEEETLLQQEMEYRERVNAIPRIKKKRLIGILSATVICIVAVIALVSYNVNKPLSNGMTKDEGEEVLATGMAYFNNGDYESAMECFQQLPSDSKQYEEAQSMLLQSKDSYRSEILDRANSHIENHEFDAAFNLISQAQSLLPNDSDLQAAYDNVYSGYQTSVLERVDSYVSSGQYEVALEYLSGIQTNFPNDATLQGAYNSTLSAFQDMVRNDAMQQADAYVADGDYVQAIDVINSAVDKIGQDEELVAKLNVYKDTYKNGILQQVSTVYDESGYDAVISLLEQAQLVLPEDGDISGEYNVWKSRQPMLLTNMEIFSGSTMVNSSEYYKDNYGTIYTNYLSLKDSVVEYYIGEQYARFTATIYVSDNDKSKDWIKKWDAITISIYGDDNLLYTKTGFSTKDKPIDIVVDVTNVEFLKIAYDYARTGLHMSLGEPTLGW